MNTEHELKLIPNLVVIPNREIVKMGRDRFIIYLPKDYNELWREIKKQKKKLRIYIEVVE